MTFLLDGFDSDPGDSGLPSAGAPAVDEALLAGLNPQQRAAVLSRSKALLIVAGAGSGKTSVLTRRIASLLQTREAWPSQILAITFTNKAAGEMRERVAQLVGGASEGMWISTFHSACVRILRRQAEAMGLKSAFTIYDSADSRAMLKRIIKELEVDTLGLTVPSVAAKISKLKNELADVDSYARQVKADDPALCLFRGSFRRRHRACRVRSHFFAGLEASSGQWKIGA